MKTQLVHTFEEIISVDNLLLAWGEFLKGKRGRQDVHFFSLHLMANIFKLHAELANHTYKHGGYQAFNIADPKPRNIHKASVRDRLLHHAIYRILYPYFDRKFIADSYSCRLNKGTHKALARFKKLAGKASKNHTKTLWVLKCDVRKFFASIDHEILKQILAKFIIDQDILWLLEQVVGSFQTVVAGAVSVVIPGLTRNPGEIPQNTNLDTGFRRYDNTKGKGLPLGNLTSQLLVNIYLNEFDQFVKHKLKMKYYIRYADDFVIFSQEKGKLENILPVIENFLTKKLQLKLHPNKVSIETLASGIDFLGWGHWTNHRVLRRVTRRRMMRNLAEKLENEAVRQSYLGLLKYGNTHKIREQLAR
ncbi:MAG: reverse transcriptase/maturase family protein [Candidatus Vogelbacteria bacterium]|nr:reverse transcriptase/maturase family protein [Candidatus Vogelbacteria bacterium]